MIPLTTFFLLANIVVVAFVSGDASTDGEFQKHDIEQSTGSIAALSTTGIYDSIDMDARTSQHYHGVVSDEIPELLHDGFPRRLLQAPRARQSVPEAGARGVSAGFVFEAAATEALANIAKRKLKWAVFRIPKGSDSGIQLVKSGASSGEDDANSEADFELFAAELPVNEPRWGVYDLNFMKNGIHNSKVCFVQYVPDACTKMTLKFAYANHKEVVKSKLQVNKELHVNDKDDVTRAKFIDEF